LEENNFISKKEGFFKTFVVLILSKVIKNKEDQFFVTLVAIQ